MAKRNKNLPTGHKWILRWTGKPISLSDIPVHFMNGFDPDCWVLFLPEYYSNSYEVLEVVTTERLDRLKTLRFICQYYYIHVTELIP